MTTRDELEAEVAAISEIAKVNPTAVMVAILDELIDNACGVNPALHDHMRLRMYRNIRGRLRRVGIAG